ncbi:MAG: nuclear transport factor 2 family protein [Chitinophagaceae bacterium]|uniref:YybH family protein n=1 Tax=unclassified Paraflavitalea TaxID=2798305 RepID=UPI003D3399BE|nr:nuclear transport factor 2 family protein [Chitinophagaceae bacterium]
MKALYSLFFIIAICGSVQAQNNKDVEAIKAMMLKQQNYWNQGNVDSFMVGYWESDSLMFVGKSGVTYGYTNTLNNYKKGYPDRAAMGTLQFTFIEFKKLNADTYFLVGKYYLTRTIGDASGHFTLIIKKIKGSWKIMVDHSS